MGINNSNNLAPALGLAAIFIVFFLMMSYSQGRKEQKMLFEARVVRMSEILEQAKPGDMLVIRDKSGLAGIYTVLKNDGRYIQVHQPNFIDKEGRRFEINQLVGIFSNGGMIHLVPAKDADTAFVNMFGAASTWAIH